MKSLSLLAAIAALTAGSCLFLEAAEPRENNENEFAGKIVAIQLATSQIVLENVKVAQCGGESFLSGMGSQWTDDEMQKNRNLRKQWWQGLPVRVNLRFVVSYTPMPLEQWKAINGLK